MNTMNLLLTFCALIETATGLALIAMPAVVVRLLLAADISGPSIALGHVAGFGLLSLGLACSPGRDATANTPPARAMLTYNVLATLYFVYVGIGGEWVGPLLWPAAALHAGLSLLLVRQWRLAGTRHQGRLVRL